MIMKSTNDMVSMHDLCSQGYLILRKKSWKTDKEAFQMRQRFHDFAVRLYIIIPLFVHLLDIYQTSLQNIVLVASVAHIFSVNVEMPK